VAKYREESEDDKRGDSKSNKDCGCFVHNSRGFNSRQLPRNLFVQNFADSERDDDFAAVFHFARRGFFTADATL
jgi:hypothetical protein